MKEDLSNIHTNKYRRNTNKQDNIQRETKRERTEPVHVGNVERKKPIQIRHTKSVRLH